MRRDESVATAAIGEEPAWSPTTPAEALRKEHSWREARLKSLGRGLFVYGCFVVTNVIYLQVIAVGVANGYIESPWINTPFYAALRIAYVAVSGTAIAAGIGLWQSRSWAKAAAIGFIAAYAGCWALLVAHLLWSSDYRNVAAALFISLFVAIPLPILFRPGMSQVLTPEYRAAVEETLYLRVKPWTPWSVKLAMLATLTVGMIIGVSH